MQKIIELKDIVSNTLNQFKNAGTEIGERLRAELDKRHQRLREIVVKNNYGADEVSVLIYHVNILKNKAAILNGIGEYTDFINEIMTSTPVMQRAFIDNAADILMSYKHDIDKNQIKIAIENVTFALTTSIGGAEVEKLKREIQTTNDKIADLYVISIANMSNLEAMEARLTTESWGFGPEAFNGHVPAVPPETFEERLAKNAANRGDAEWFVEQANKKNNYRPGAVNDFNTNEKTTEISYDKYR